MFGWLRRWFGKTEAVGLWRPEERLIWEYFNGERMVKADPLVLSRRIADAGAAFATACGAAASGGKFARQAQDEVSGHLRTIFALKPLTDGEVVGTLSDDEAADLFLAFRKWQQGLKKNWPTTSGPAVATSAPSPSSPAGGPPTPSTSASGSTSGSSSTGRPASSPTEPASPSAPSRPPSPTSVL